MESRFPNIRHMRVFRETVRRGSVSAAAERCHLSQPAATQAIARLEADFGTPLLIRRTRELVPTECGALLVARVEAALDQLSKGARAAARAGKVETRGAGQSFDAHVTAAQIRSLIAIANTGSFTVAGRRLGISQPTVHRAARNLEAIAGTPLFHATAAGVELTAAAQAFAVGAKLAHAEIRQAHEEIGKELGVDRGTFNLGTLPLSRTSIVPGAVDAMVSAHDSVQIRVFDGRYDQLLRNLREGDLDCLIGALRDPAPADDVTQEVLFHDDLAIVAHPRHPLAQRKSATLEDTLAYPWIAPPRDTPTGSYLFETLQIHKREKTPVRVVSSSLVLLRGVLARGDYVSIISRHQISIEERDGHIVPLPIELKDNTRPIGLTYRTDWRPTQTQARFIELLRRFGTVEPRQSCRAGEYV